MPRGTGKTKRRSTATRRTRRPPPALSFLVLEDDPSDRRQVLASLRTFGCKGRSVATHQQVLKWAERGASHFILDLQIKNDNRYGLAVLRDLKRSYPHVFVAILTRHDNGNRKVAETLEADIFLRKGLDRLEDIRQIAYAAGVLYLRQVLRGLKAREPDENLPVDPAEMQKKFKQLRRKWLRQVRTMSSLEDMTADLAYLEIIALGKPLVPVLLRELLREPNYWFVALTAITGKNVVKERHRGLLEEMAKDWLVWGEAKGYLSR